MGRAATLPWMDEDAFDRAQRLREEMSRTPGARAHREVQAIRRTHRLFQANANELRTFLAQYEDPATALKLWDLNDPRRLAAFFDEIDRLLHNYLAAALTLRDHGRNLRERYREEHPQFADEYNAEAAAIRDSPRLRFVQDLRNYMLHYRLPVVQGQLTIGPKMESSVLLLRDKLREWENWSAAAKSYLEDAPEAIRIVDELDAYSEAVSAFQEWLLQAFAALHPEDLEELKRLQEQLSEAERKAFGHVPQETTFD